MKEGLPPGRPPSRRRRRRKRAVKARSLPTGATRWRSLRGWGAWVGLGALFLIGGAVTGLLVVFGESKGPGHGDNVELDVAWSEPVSLVAHRLAEKGAVRSAALFSWYARLTRAEIAGGHHLLVDNVSPREILLRLERKGGAARARAVVPEGYSSVDIGRRLESLHIAAQSAFLEASREPKLLRELGIDGGAEGFLFPATYDFPEDSDPREIVRTMKSEFDKRFASLEGRYRASTAQLASSLGWGRREIVTLASMVEKEAALDDERPLVASVFLNRLRDPTFRPRLLQCDATALYGCLVLGERVPGCTGFAGRATHAINMDPANAYSTYVHEGLPPGPIANPGLKAIEAVLAPAGGRYLYFVARGEGRRHTFSETLEAHSAAVRELRDRLRSRAESAPE